MAICVYEHVNTTIRNGGDVLATCSDYVLLEPVDYIAITDMLNGSGNALPVGDPAVGLLIGSSILLLSSAWVIRQVLGFLSTNPNRS